MFGNANYLLFITFVMAVFADDMFGFFHNSTIANKNACFSFIIGIRYLLNQRAS